MPKKKIVKIIEELKRLIKEQFPDLRGLYLYGSQVKGGAHKDSDIDVMVQFFPDHSWGWEIVRMDEELAEIFGRKVDVAHKNAIEKDQNWIRRKNILSSAKLIYEQEEK